MARQHPRTLLVLAASFAAAALVAACGDDSTDTTEVTIVGSWTATSLTAPSQPQWGNAVTDDGLVVHWTFSAAGSYSFSVANDWPDDPWICTGTASCSWSGTYSISGNEILFDEGTADEVTVTHTLAGDQLTIVFPAGDGIADPYRYVLQRD